LIKALIAPKTRKEGSGAHAFGYLTPPLIE
jgi:hypothetical protein